MTPSRKKVKSIRPVSAVPVSRDLLRWYDKNRRALPWRVLPGEVPDPYRVWLSEIMLQQTTVGAVAPYFQKFIKKWPSVEDLAGAPLDDIMRQWAGLGYYRRARSLHECAQQIVTDYRGQFPEDEKALLDLPGFGPYTAAAVRSIAFDQSANVVDGNVERVMARIFAIRTPLPKAKPALRAAAATLLPTSRFGDYAQALMDLGSIICTPRNPKCDLCPWQKNCKARSLGIADKLPARAKVKAKPVRRAIAFVLLNDRGEILLRQRPKTGLLGGMMEVPSSVWRVGSTLTLREVKNEAPTVAAWSLLPGTVHHVFSHFEFEIQVATATIKRTNPMQGIWVKIKDLEGEALPSVMRKIIRHAIGR